MTDLGGVTRVEVPGAVAPTGYQTIQEEGVNLAQRSTLDFTGAGVTASDTGAKTLVSIPGATGVAGYATVKDEGTGLPQRTVLNFTGAGVTSSDVAGETQVTVPVPTVYNQTLQDEGVALTQRSAVNFTGAGVMVTDTGTKTQVDVSTTVSTTFEANTQTVAYTIVLTDATKIIHVNSASAVSVTIPANATTAFPVGSWLEVYQQGTGQVSIAGAAGVTLRSRGGLLGLAGQYAEVRLRKSAADIWVISGDLA